MNNGQLHPTPMEHPNSCRQLALAPWLPATWLVPTGIKPVGVAGKNAGQGGKAPITVTRASDTALPNQPRKSTDKHGILVVRHNSITRVTSSLPAADVMDAIDEPPNPPRDVRTLEHSHRYSITNWKAALMSLKGSMSKVGTEGAGPPELRSLPPLEDQTAIRGPEWSHTAGSATCSGIVTLEILSEKIARLRQAGGTYRAACDLFINRLLEMDLAGEDTLTHFKSHPSRQNMVYRGQEEEETIEQARSQLVSLRSLEGGRNSSDSSSSGEPTWEVNNINHESIQDIRPMWKIVEEDRETGVRTLHSSLAAPGHRESQTPKVARKRVAQP